MPHGAKTAVPGTGCAQNHECRRALTKALGDVWAVGLLADGVQAGLAEKILHVDHSVLFFGRDALPEPGWLLGFFRGVPHSRSCYARSRNPFCHPALKHLAKGQPKALGYFCQMWCPPQFLCHRGHPSIGAAAGDEQVKMRQLWSHIERQSMTGDSAPHGQAHRRDLAAASSAVRGTYPHARMAIHTPRPQAVRTQHPDRRFLQAPGVSVEVAIGWPENRVGYELPWTVVGGLTATVCREHANAQLAQRLRSGEDILFASATTNRDHRGMLEQEQRVADCPRGSGHGQILLQATALLVFHRSQMVCRHNVHHVPLFI